MKKSVKVILLDWGNALGGGASTGPHGIITLGIGLPENDLIWFFTSGLNIGPEAPPPAPMSAPALFYAEPVEEMIAVEPDSVFAQREPVEEEYTGRVLWSDMRVSGTPSLLSKVVSLVKRVLK